MIYYIRTFPIRKTQLENMITGWEQPTADTILPLYWLSSLESTILSSDDPIVYIRYVGMAEKGKTAFDRFKEDLKQRKAGSS